LRICLDSSYLLPLFGVGLRDIPSDVVRRLRAQEHELLISEISIFECAAKAAKLVARGELNIRRLIDGLLGVAYSPSFIRISIYEADLIGLAVEARMFISDFIDCIILATATLYADVLLTEDKLLLDLPDELNELINSFNPRLAILSFEEYSRGHRGHQG